MIITRTNKLQEAIGWYELAEHMYLSSADLRDAGPSGAAGKPQRDELLSAHHPDATKAPVLRPCISVSQVHSLRIVLIRREDTAGSYVIETREAVWGGESQTELVLKKPQRVARWQAEEFMKRWPQLLAIEADGVMTNDASLDLAVTVADCMPVFVSGGRWRAALHSGWAGTGILSLALGFLQEVTASSAGDEAVQIVLGPCISAVNYQVGQDRADLFRKRFGDHAVSGVDNRFLDLRSVNIELARQGGVASVKLYDSCTVAESGLFSYRQDGPQNYKRMLALYAGKPETRSQEHIV